jgi:hypothetical protein
MSLCGIEAKRAAISLPTAISDPMADFACLKLEFLRQPVVKQSGHEHMTGCRRRISQRKRGENGHVEMPYSFVS